MSEPNFDLQTLISTLHQALEVGEDDKVRELVRGLEPAELAVLLESFPQDVRADLWRSTGHEADTEVLLHMTAGGAAKLADELGSEVLIEAAEELDATDVAGLVETLPDEITEDLLSAMDGIRREQIEAILSFGEDTVGRIMHRDTVTVRADATVAVVRRYLALLRDVPENTDIVMVVTREKRFVGTIRTLDILQNPDDATVESFMQGDIETVSPQMGTHDLAHLFANHDLRSAPVVDEQGLLLGRVVVEDVLDILKLETEHAILAHAGLDEEEDLFSPIIPSAKRRALWLGINLATAFLAAWVIGWFEEALEKVVALAVLMPIVASMGGIAGSQTLSLAIRGLALRQIAPSNAPWLLRKELGIGILNGTFWAIVVAGVAIAWFGDLRIGAIIATALVVNMMAAAGAGLLVPLTLKRLNIDPALSGAVILTTVTDVIGFLCFLGLATIFLL